MSVRYLIKIGEIALKGRNKAFFEKRLQDNMRILLQGLSVKIHSRDRRFYLDVPESSVLPTEEALSALFGIVAFTPTMRCEKNLEALKKTAAGVLEGYARKTFAAKADSLASESVSFKIEARRTDKSFPHDSYEIATEVGEHLRRSLPFLRVDVRNPQWKLRIEIREQVYLYIDEKKGPGGLPVASAGKGLLLLSGGIDSPVAGYLMAKRGLAQEAVYFHAYPYTSDEALEKVKRLSAVLSTYLVGTKLHVVPFTEFQLRINDKAKKEETTLLMRAGMVRIAELLAERIGAGALISGESLSQVASQTIESLRFTGSMSGLPIFRPLIGLDKAEIIRIARNIGSYEISILPYDDCCTIFSPENPLVRPNFAAMRDSWALLDGEDLLKKAIEEKELIEFPPHSGVRGESDGRRDGER
jgi:tRNA uracil 4-sulfurtransferase